MFGQGRMWDEFDADKSSKYNSGIHNHVAYIILDKRNQNGERLLTSQQGVKLFYSALSEKGLLTKNASFAQSRLALSSAVFSGIFPDSFLENSVSEAINEAFDYVWEVNEPG